MKDKGYEACYVLRRMLRPNKQKLQWAKKQKPATKCEWKEIRTFSNGEQQ